MNDDKLNSHKTVAVCGKCMHHQFNPVIEINFRDESIYYVCPSCGVSNKIKLKADTVQPYPRSRKSKL